jgi:hypothetical protein
VAVLHDPGHAAALLAGSPADVTVAFDPPIPPRPVRDGAETFDVVVCFVDRGEDLASRFRAAARLISWAGGLWVSWPKMSSPLFVDLREGTIRAFGLDEGLVDNKVCAVDGDWSGLRFVIRREDRPVPPARRR